MKLTIDCSGKNKSVNEKHVVALSNSSKFAVLVRASTKKNLRKKYKHRVKRFETQLHCITLYYCLKDRVDFCSAVQICPDGHNVRWLKLYLIKLLGNNFVENKVIFAPLKKHDNAHVYANSVRKGSRSHNLILSEGHFRQFFELSPKLKAEAEA